MTKCPIDLDTRYLQMNLSTTILFLCLVSTSGAAAQYLSTRIITGEGVYIFGPSLAEADNVSVDQVEALNDFTYYSGRIASFVRARGLTCEYVSARTIKIRFASKRFFTVYRDSVEFGTILADGRNKPRLYKYVVTDDELAKECKEYFNLK